MYSSNYVQMLNLEFNSTVNYKMSCHAKKNGKNIPGIDKITDKTKITGVNNRTKKLKRKWDDYKVRNKYDGPKKQSYGYLFIKKREKVGK